LTFVADEKGFFKKEGLDIELIYTQGGRYSLDALLAGSAEAANIVGENVGYYGYTGGRDLKVLSVIISSTSNAIVARRSAGISKPEDLEGKRLAISPGTTSDVFSRRFMDVHGIKNVQIIRVQPNAMQMTVLAKGADAAATWDPFISNIAKQLGKDAVVFYEPASTYLGYMFLAVSPAWERAHPQAVRKLENAYQMAAEFAARNPEESQAIVARRASMDLETVETDWKLTDFSLRPAGVALPEVQKIGAWIHANQDGYATKPVPDYSIYFK
jgi:ABC-type nitrate/sulfonate/bicarbonate transport system substrate-binding protein